MDGWMKASPTALHQRDAAGNTPLHLACRNTSVAAAAIVCLLMEVPPTLQCTLELIIIATAMTTSRWALGLPTCPYPYP